MVDRTRSICDPPAQHRSSGLQHDRDSIRSSGSCTATGTRRSKPLPGPSSVITGEERLRPFTEWQGPTWTRSSVHSFVTPPTIFATAVVFSGSVIEIRPGFCRPSDGDGDDDERLDVDVYRTRSSCCASSGHHHHHPGTLFTTTAAPYDSSQHRPRIASPCRGNGVAHARRPTSGVKRQA